MLRKDEWYKLRLTGMPNQRPLVENPILASGLKWFQSMIWKTHKNKTLWLTTKTSEILRSDQHTRSSSEILRSDQHTQNFLCTTHCLIYTLHIFITTTWFLYKLHCRHLGRQSELVSCTSALVGINNAAQYTVCHLHEVALLTNAVWRVERKQSSWTLLTILLEQSCDLNAIQQSLSHYNGKYTT